MIDQNNNDSNDDTDWRQLIFVSATIPTSILMLNKSSLVSFSRTPLQYLRLIFCQYLSLENLAFFLIRAFSLKFLNALAPNQRNLSTVDKLNKREE